MRYGDAATLDRQDFTATVLRGDKVGLIGPNGAGKTTLLKLILGELQPTVGHRASRARSSRSPTSTRCAARSTSTRRWPTRSARAASGSRSASARKHVMSYLGDFLFAPERANSPLRRCRAASATACCWRACSRCRPTCWCSTSRPTTSTSTRSSCSRSCCQTTPAPCSWSATTAASSTTSSPARSPGKATSAPGLWREYEGGYEDWKTQKARARACARRDGRRGASRPPRGSAAKGAAAPPRRRAALRRAAGAAPASAPRRKLSYKEQRELDELPARIEALEREQKELGALLASAELYAERPGARRGGADALRADRRRAARRARALGSARRALKRRSAPPLLRPVQLTPATGTPAVGSDRGRRWQRTSSSTSPWQARRAHGAHEPVGDPRDPQAHRAAGHHLARRRPAVGRRPSRSRRCATRPTRVLRETPREALQYAASEGFAPLREWVAGELGRQGLARRAGAGADHHRLAARASTSSARC